MNLATLKSRIEQVGLRPSEVVRMGYGLVSLNQASQWIGFHKTDRKLSAPVIVMLLKMCDEKVAGLNGVPLVDHIVKLEKEDRHIDNVNKILNPKKKAPIVKQSPEKEPPKEWPVAFPVLARSYGEMTVRQVGDFWFLEYKGTGWKLPKSRKAEKVLLGKDLVKWSEFKTI